MKKFGAVLCSLILIPTLFCSFLLMSLEGFMSKKNIETILDEMSFAEITEETFQDNGELYETLSEFGITKEAFNEAIDSKIIKQATSDVVNNILDYYIRGNEKAEILTEEQLEKLLKEAVVTFVDLAKVEIPSDVEQKIYDLARPELQKIQEEFPTVKDLEQASPEMEETFRITKIIFGKEVKLVLVLLFALTFIGIFLLRKKAKTYLFCYGVNTLITSIFLYVVFGLLMVITKMEFKGTENAQIATILHSFTSKGMIYATVLLVLSILLFIAHCFINKEKKTEVKEAPSN